MKRFRAAHTGWILFVFALILFFTTKLYSAAAHAPLSPMSRSGLESNLDPKIYLPVIFSPPPEQQWTIITVDSAHPISDMGDHSLRLTSSGRPRIAYGSNHLYYAHLEDAGWAIDTVDGASGVGRYASLALDWNNSPYISYYDQTKKDLKYARWNGSFWETLTIDAGNSINGAGRYTSIAVGSDILPRIIYLGNYYNSSQAIYLEDLRYAYFDGLSWYIQVIDNSDNIGGYTSIGLDPDNHVHASYFDDDNNNNLKYIQYTGSAWFQITLDYADAGYYSSIAVDKDSHVFISYLDKGAGHLKMVSFHNDDLDTKKETVDPGSSTGQYTSIVLDSHNWPHIAYYDYGKKDLKYARWNGAAWVITTIDSAGDVGKFASLALDSHDLAHVSYYDATHSSLKYAVENYLVP